MKKAGKKLSILSMLLYVIAAALAAYAIWAFIFCHDYISELVANDQLTTSGNEFSIVSYYMTNCIQYILYAIAFFFFGKIYRFAVNNAQYSKSKRKPSDDVTEDSLTMLNPDREDEANDSDDFSGWKSS